MESIREVAEDTAEELGLDMEIVAPRALESLERAQIDMQIATAKKYPRDLAKVRAKMMSFATLDEDTAAACFYSLPRAGKTIPGPSVRLAEIAVSCYGNIRVASRLIDNDGKMVTAQGITHDLENNVMISVESSRRITDKHGKTFNEDMQMTTGNAAISFAFRNSVFRTIPMALIKPVYDKCREVAIGNASTLVAKRTKMFGRLNLMGITDDRILARLEKTSIENVDLTDLEILIGLGTSVKDGETTVDLAFPPVAGNASAQKGVATEKLGELNKKRAARTAAKDSPGPNAGSAPGDKAGDTAPGVANAGEGGQAVSSTAAAASDSPNAGEMPTHINDLLVMRDKLGVEKWSEIILTGGFDVPITPEDFQNFSVADVLKLAQGFDKTLREKQTPPQSRLKL